jgi:stringent starvation protein B
VSESASTKPYMIRAIYEWCVDNGYTPHLLVAVNSETRVPLEFVKDGEIVLNINHSAANNLLIGNDDVTFAARFNGVSNKLYIPVDAVLAIFARENGQGVYFGNEATTDQEQSQEKKPPADSGQPAPVSGKKPGLRLVK